MLAGCRTGGARQVSEDGAPTGGESASAGKEPVSAGKELVLTIPGPGKVKLRMKEIPAGTFAMGSPKGEKGREQREGPMHQVVISKPFHMGVFEVTQAQWEAVMGTNPSEFNGKPANPVERVSWKECQEFVEKLNGMGIGTFRLPTEAEWEYACRAGTRTAYSFGGDASKLKEYANHDATPKYGDKSTAPVGGLRPNPWGLYGMHGNVYEWCCDWYATYSRDKQTDPSGAAFGSFRVLRGGCWRDSSGACRSALRGARSPSIQSTRYYGFRLVREVQ
jgi:formylglycine-generating enzyme required for sulfatase activity